MVPAGDSKEDEPKITRETEPDECAVLRRSTCLLPSPALKRVSLCHAAASAGVVLRIHTRNVANAVDVQHCASSLRRRVECLSCSTERARFPCHACSFWQTPTEAKGENPAKDPLAIIGVVVSKHGPDAGHRSWVFDARFARAGLFHCYCIDLYMWVTVHRACFSPSSYWGLLLPPAMLTSATTGGSSTSALATTGCLHHPGSQGSRFAHGRSGSNGTSPGGAECTRAG